MLSSAGSSLPLQLNGVRREVSEDSEPPGEECVQMAAHRVAFLVRESHVVELLPAALRLRLNMVESCSLGRLACDFKIYRLLAYPAHPAVPLNHTAQTAPTFP